MGLDMNLYPVYKNGKRGDDQDNYSVYWRKANAILGWFERNIKSANGKIENCTNYDVTLDELRALVKQCRNVLRKGEEYAKKEMPTKSGFFFGSTEHDDGYYEDITQTIAAVNFMLSNEQVVGAIFHAWW